jgi:methylmalonyl-CoA mutase N-terminal domain/subunit
LEAVASNYHELGYRFAPLVREKISLVCSLDILFLRRDIPGGVITSAGDIDNRIKTVIDALRRPRYAQELVGNEVPSEGENPFFCLMEDDSQVDRLSVETDALLNVGEDSDHRRVQLVITVDVRPFNVTTFNLSFAS